MKEMFLDYIQGIIAEPIGSIFVFLGMGAIIASYLLKGKSMKVILILAFLSNAFVAIGYLLQGQGINGAASCLTGAVFSIINFLFDSKNKEVPRPLVAFYGLAFIGVNIAVNFKNMVNFEGGFSLVPIQIVLCVLAILGCLAFVMCIGQKNGAKYRFWNIMNMLMWCTYDVISGNFVVLITHLIQMGFAVVGMIIHDRKKSNK